jgi:hypothetical protein
MKRPSFLPLGTITAGTLRPADLLEHFTTALSYIRLTRAERATVREITRTFEEDEDTDVDALIDIASNHAPDMCYVGTLEGDGACFGVWPSWDRISEAEHDGDLVRLTDLSELDNRTPYYILLVSDHGNATLYRRAGNGHLIQLWSVV